MKIFTLPINIFFMLIFFINEGFCLAPKSLLEEHIYEEIPYDDHKNETKGKKKLSREDDSESEIFQEVTHFDLNRVKRKEKKARRRRYSNYISSDYLSSPVDAYPFKYKTLFKYEGPRFIKSEVKEAFHKKNRRKRRKKRSPKKKDKGVRQDSEQTKGVRQHRKILPNYYSNERIENFDNGDLSLEESEDFRYAASYVYQSNPILPKKFSTPNKGYAFNFSQERQPVFASQNDFSIHQDDSNVDLDGYLVPVGSRVNPYKSSGIKENQRFTLQARKEGPDFSFDRKENSYLSRRGSIQDDEGFFDMVERDEEFQEDSDSFFDMGHVWNYIMVNLFEEGVNLETYSYITSESFAITLFHTIVKTLYKGYELMKEEDQVQCLIKSLFVMKNISQLMDEVFRKKEYKKDSDFNHHLKVYFKRILHLDHDDAIIRLMDKLVDEGLALKTNIAWFHLILQREWDEALEKQINTRMELIPKMQVMKDSFFSDLLSSFNDNHQQRYAA
ncbi:hypothetical protein AB834_00770 [PVC group bacterium (ex Bugula neritina AB1)]|nr:hypothetical protein AB834_00770 [PVC group bacterium (ex Bugula neritina AB1)]